MTTTYPLTVDSFDTHVDNVDDVMAADVNNLNDAVVALETWHRDAALMRVKNTSGSTVAANDLGYIDYAGEFKLTTTAYLDGVAWAVVVEGAANNADIIVARRGLVTVICNGNATVGQYLYTSTTTKQAQPQSYVRPGILAVVKTANSSGAGGTAVALLYTGRMDVDLSSASYLWDKGSNHSGSDFVATQDGAPAGAVITYDAPSSGNEEFINPNASLLTYMICHNTTKATSAKIASVNLATNAITFSAAGDVAAWDDEDVLTIRSQVCTGSIGTDYFADLEFQDATVVPALAVGVIVSGGFRDTGGAGERFTSHAWTTYAASARFDFRAEVANSIAEGSFPMMPLYQRTFCFLASASGGATINTQFFQIRGARVAIP